MVDRRHAHARTSRLAARHAGTETDQQPADQLLPHRYGRHHLRQDISFEARPFHSGVVGAFRVVHDRGRQTRYDRQPERLYAGRGAGLLCGRDAGRRPDAQRFGTAFRQPGTRPRGAFLAGLCAAAAFAERLPARCPGPDRRGAGRPVAGNGARRGRVAEPLAAGPRGRSEGRAAPAFARSDAPSCGAQLRAALFPTFCRPFPRGIGNGAQFLFLR